MLRGGGGAGWPVSECFLMLHVLPPPHGSQYVPSVLPPFAVIDLRSLSLPVPGAEIVQEDLPPFPFV